MGAWKTAWSACGATLVVATLSTGVAHAQESGAGADALGDLSIEQLSNLQVTSVSGRAQTVNEAPAAVYVISSDDIVRSGVRSIPGALRLAPNLQVGRSDSASYGISARGFNQSTGTANKLLVLVDGRIVYTPLFSGVFWDEQNTILEDLDRIEVVSGPGGTLWGSNAVNGVINIVSRDAHETTGLLVTGGASDTSQALGLRYGARFGDSGAFRVYGLGLKRGVDAPNEFLSQQAGFRADWSNAVDTVTLQGDVYGGDQRDMPGQIADTTIDGGNLLGRWSRRFADDSGFQLQAYYDRTSRQVASGITADVDALDVSAQYNLAIARVHNLVFGGGVRATSDSFKPGPATAFLKPSDRTLRTFHFYAQDSIDLGANTDLIFGLKAEHNTYTGMEYMPSVRLAWRPSGHEVAWAAVSRAVRTPSRFDRDLSVPGQLAGGPDFVSETLTAYELGYRAQPTERFWFSASAYFNEYDDLRTLEASGPGVFPLVIRNGMHGQTYGFETWGAYALADWWRLNAGLSLLHKDLKLDAGSADMLGVDFAGNDPSAQATLRSLMDIGARTEFDVTVRAVGELPNPKVSSYVAIDMRVGFRMTDHLEVAVSGSNLFDDHVEFINPNLPANEVTRSVFISARWRQ